MEEVWIAFGLTVFAGMATGIGSLIAFVVKRTNYRFLAVSTGFSAGVMLYISFVEIFFKGAESLTARYGGSLGNWINAASFFGGMALIGLIDNLIPAGQNPHEPHPAEEIAEMQDSSAPHGYKPVAFVIWKEKNLFHDRPYPRHCRFRVDQALRPA